MQQLSLYLIKNSHRDYVKSYPVRGGITSLRGEKEGINRGSIRRETESSF